MGGVLAIDYGEQKCGFAYADRSRIVVRPLEALRHGGRADDLLHHVTRLLDEREVATILVGLPLNMDGSAGERAAATHGFIDRLRASQPGLAYAVWDERLSTKEAESRLHEAGYRGREAKERKDSWAAWIILQDWIGSGEPLLPSA